jgi:3-oxosteroid 1-dehydrogenase
MPAAHSAIYDGGSVKSESPNVTELREDVLAGKFDRRRLLIGGALAGAALGSVSVEPSLAAAAQSAKGKGFWSGEADVVCVGSGAAALSAAVAAVDHGATVIVLEKMPVLGGTTTKSGGVVWVPNNSWLMAAGMADPREDALRYMARYSFPDLYNVNSPTLGIPEPQYRQLEAFYDNASPVVERLKSSGALYLDWFKTYNVNELSPDYAEYLPENKTPKGRAIWVRPAPETGKTWGSEGYAPLATDVGSTTGPGTLLVRQLEKWLRDRKVPILTDHQVIHLIEESGRVIGVEVMAEDKMVRLRARRGVIFGTGGYAQNRDYVERYQPLLSGACARPSSTGDFIPIASQVGAKMGPLNTAWRADVVLEEAIDTPALGTAIFLVPGDSMFYVNRYGRRVVDEKRNYHDRTAAFHLYDPMNAEYPNKYLFMIFDERTLDSYGGSFPLPRDRREVSYIITGETLETLAANIQNRLDKLRSAIGDFNLDKQFVDAFRKSVLEYNGYARAGKDKDFRRGDFEFDRIYHVLSSTIRQGGTYPPNNMPNTTMYPLSDRGPYHAIILAPGALDTNSGPVINERSEVVDNEMKPIPGLYAAGNCIASPTKGAYYGAGCTLAMALTFGFIAGRNAAKASG